MKNASHMSNENQYRSDRSSGSYIFHAIVAMFPLLRFVAPLAILTLACSIICKAQTFPSPTASSQLGIQSPTALAEVTSFVQQSSVNNWADLQATGTLTYPGGDPLPATLTLIGSKYSQLDIAMPEGTRSIRISKSSGQVVDPVRGTQSIPMSAAFEGIVAFPRIWKDATYTTGVSLIDGGIVVVNGSSLHRITFEYVLDPRKVSPNRESFVTDLYFDPQSHLLLYSVTSVGAIDFTARQRIHVISYGQYQQFSGVLIPTAIQQTVDGSPTWSLQLSSVQLNTNPAIPTF